MRIPDRILSLLLSALLLVIIGLRSPENWRLTVFSALLFVIGWLILPPLIKLIKLSDRTGNLILGAFFMIIINLKYPKNWDVTLFSVLIFVIGGLILPPLITFMTNEKRDNLYK